MNDKPIIVIDVDDGGILITYNKSTNVFIIHHNNKNIHDDVLKLEKNKDEGKCSYVPVSILYCYYYLTNWWLLDNYNVRIKENASIDNKYKYHDKSIIEDGLFMLFIITLFIDTGKPRKLLDERKKGGDIKINDNLIYSIPLLFESHFPWLDELKTHMKKSMEDMKLINNGLEPIASITYNIIKARDYFSKKFNNLVFELFNDGITLKVDKVTKSMYEELAIGIYCVFATALAGTVGIELNKQKQADERIKEVRQLLHKYYLNKMINNNGDTIH